MKCRREIEHRVEESSDTVQDDEQVVDPSPPSIRVYDESCRYRRSKARRGERENEDDGVHEEPVFHGYELPNDKGVGVASTCGESDQDLTTDNNRDRFCGTSYDTSKGAKEGTDDKEPAPRRISWRSVCDGRIAYLPKMSESLPTSVRPIARPRV
jgi:hypothetical protein